MLGAPCAGSGGEARAGEEGDGGMDGGAVRGVVWRSVWWRRKTVAVWANGDGAGAARVWRGGAGT
jgi:hypothetical protein